MNDTPLTTKSMRDRRANCRNFVFWSILELLHSSFFLAVARLRSSEKLCHDVQMEAFSKSPSFEGFLDLDKTGALTSPGTIAFVVLLILYTLYVSILPSSNVPKNH